MCTVTFLPLKNDGFILTSNRDEQPNRITHPPLTVVEDETTLLFPKDEIAGGTWIGTSSKKRLVCVLNGAFVKHNRKNNYVKSRGVIAKELLKTNHLNVFIEALNLENIEPFTMVIVDWNNGLQLFELIWDEEIRHFNKLSNEPKIWSSATLYPNDIKELRKEWFQKWMSENDYTSESILKFHHSQLGTIEESILMKRTYVETVSITSVKKENTSVEMNYEDIQHQKKYKSFF